MGFLKRKKPSRNVQSSYRLKLLLQESPTEISTYSRLILLTSVFLFSIEILRFFQVLFHFLISVATFTILFNSYSESKVNYYKT